MRVTKSERKIQNLLNAVSRESTLRTKQSSVSVFQTRRSGSIASRWIMWREREISRTVSLQKCYRCATRSVSGYTVSLYQMFFWLMSTWRLYHSYFQVLVQAFERSRESHLPSQERGKEEKGVSHKHKWERKQWRKRHPVKAQVAYSQRMRAITRMIENDVINLEKFK